MGKEKRVDISQRKKYEESVRGALSSDPLNNQVISVKRCFYNHQLVKGKTIKSLTMPNVGKNMKKTGILNADSSSENCHKL